MQWFFVPLLVLYSSTTLAKAPAEPPRPYINGFYVGGGITQTDLDVSDENDPCNSFLADCDNDEIGQIPLFSDSTGDDTGFSVHAGYRHQIPFIFGLGFAGEIGYVDYGTLNYAAKVTDRPDLAEFAEVNSRFDTKAINVSGLAILPFAKRWEVYVRAGLSYWEASGKQTLITTQTGEVIQQNIDEDGTGVLLGVGAGVSFFSHSHIRLEFRVLDTGADDELAFPGSDKTIDIDGFALEYQYRFGDNWQL